jgi:hypothetical protein
MDSLITILLSPHNNRMSGLLTRAYAIEADRTCICVEEERELQNMIDINSNIMPLSSTPGQETSDLEVLLGPAGESDREADTGLLDSSTESLENTTLASVQMELATLSVSREASSPTQMPGQQPVSE